MSMHRSVRLLIGLLVIVALMTMGHLSVRPTVAQETTGLTLSLQASTTKAKVGDFVAFTARVENTGTTTITGLLINLNLPDALDARAINCPGDNGGSTVFCTIGDFAPGSVADVLFAVEVGSRETILNGPVTVSASSNSADVATASVPALKIVGPQSAK
jgi:uncharacterized repeat protein (TIGR01451 family)